jgi:cell division protein FtsL
MGLLLAGVVALNVAVLRLNLQSDHLTEERSRLRAESAELSSKLAVRAASARTSSLARNRLGLEQADPSTTTYLDLRRR